MNCKDERRSLTGGKQRPLVAFSIVLAENYSGIVNSD